MRKMRTKNTTADASSLLVLCTLAPIYVFMCTATEKYESLLNTEALSLLLHTILSAQDAERRRFGMCAHMHYPDFEVFCFPSKADIF